MALANGQRQAAVYGQSGFAEAGGLMSYSFSLIEQHRAAASYIDKILKGADPAALPVEQPTRFELVLNLKTAKAQGISFPAPARARRSSDRMIEAAGRGRRRLPLASRITIHSSRRLHRR